MLAALGALLLLLAGNGFLAWRLSTGLIGTQLVAGLVLIVAQCLRIQREPAAASESKGEATNGSW
jgi:hypothetical protein